MTLQEYLDWYVEAYDSGTIREENYSECANYLEGFIAGSNSDDPGLKRCAAMLRGGYNFFSNARRKSDNRQ